MMNALILTAVLAFAQSPAAIPPDGADRARSNTTASLNGTWTVVCYEKDGKDVTDAKNITVMFKDGVATFTGAKDNMMSPMKFDFGPQGTIRVSETRNTDPSKPSTTEQKGPPMSGVYVHTKDYLAICLHDATPPSDVTTASGTVQQPNRNQNLTKSKCTVILKRGDSARSNDK